MRTAVRLCTTQLSKYTRTAAIPKRPKLGQERKDDHKVGRPISTKFTALRGRTAAMKGGAQ